MKEIERRFNFKTFIPEIKISSGRWVSVELIEDLMIIGEDEACKILNVESFTETDKEDILLLIDKLKTTLENI